MSVIHRTARQEMRTIILIFFFFEICAENFANFGGYTYAFDRFISVDFLARFNEPDGKQAYKFGSSDNGSVINFDSFFFDKAFEEQFFADGQSVNILKSDFQDFFFKNFTPCFFAAESVTQAINYSQSDSGEAFENVNNNIPDVFIDQNSNTSGDDSNNQRSEIWKSLYKLEHFLDTLHVWQRLVLSISIGVLLGVLAIKIRKSFHVR